MMKMTLGHADAVRRSVELKAHFHEYLPKGTTLPDSPLDLEYEAMADLFDAAMEALTNHAPVVQQFTAEQDKGAYDVTICGVAGAYYVDAPEYDAEGVFSTLEEARNAVRMHYGEFLLGNAAREA